jgi:hypothetical protein
VTAVAKPARLAPSTTAWSPTVTGVRVSLLVAMEDSVGASDVGRIA